VVDGSMSGKDGGVTTGDPWGRTAQSSRAGVRAPIVAMKRITTVERRACRKVRADEAEGSYEHCVSAHRAVPHRAKSPLSKAASERRTQSKQKLASGPIASWGRRLDVLSDQEESDLRIR